MKQHIYNWRPSPKLPFRRLFAAAPDATTDTYPEHLSLDVKIPAYDQGQFGTCACNAIARAFQFALQRQDEPVFMPSRLALYYLARQKEGTLPQDAGITFTDLIEIAKTVGVTDELLWPYTPDVTLNMPPSDAAIAFSRTQDVLESKNIPSGNIVALVQCLTEGSPFVAGIPVFDSMETKAVADTGIIPMPTDNDTCLGSHGVYFDEWNGELEMFGGYNSWGTGWGRKDIGGKFWIPAEYLRLGASDIQTIQKVT